MSTIFRNQEPLGKQIRMLLLIKVQKEILTTGMLMATNTRPIKAARHLKNGQEGYQLVLGPPARQSRYLSGHATFLLQRCVNQLSKITATLRDCLQSAFSLRSIEFLVWACRERKGLGRAYILVFRGSRLIFLPPRAYSLVPRCG